MNRSKLREVALPLVILVAVAALGYFAYYRMNRGKLPQSEHQVQQISRDTLPDRFPIDMPIPENVSIRQNQEIFSEDGRMQQTRAYIAERNIDAERASFETYFADTGWAVEDARTGDGFASFLAARGDITAHVTLNAQPSGHTAVDVTVTLTPVVQ